MTNYEKLNDKELIELFENGKDKAFIVLYKRYYEIVYSFIIKYLKSSELAEDVCQNTFFKIWERRNDLKITSFKNFALTVARKDRKSTRLNSSHVSISYAVFCLKKNRVL